MNRRGFLRSLFAGAAALTLPRWLEWLWPAPRGLVAWRMYTRAVVLNEAWMCIVHPDCERDIRTMVAKEKWHDAYKRARIDKFSGSPAEILARYKPVVLGSETGTVYGVKLISTATIK